MNEEEKHIDLIDLATKKLTNEATRAELDQLDAAIAESDQNQKTYLELERTWEESRKGHGITKEETEEEWNRLHSAIKTNSHKKDSFSIYKIAAVVALVILGSITSYFFFQNAETTIVAANVQNEILEDGSKVTLNSNTSLTISEDFNKQSRTVALDGEAYFEVEASKSKPFIIQTRGIDVTVVGTSFNVKAIENSETSEVVVNSGTVQLSSATATVLLSAGEKGVLIRNSGKLFKIENDNPNYQSWKTKKFEFSDTPLKEVIEALNTVYNKSLYLENHQLQNCPITVSFENQSFESIVQIITNTLDLRIEETDLGLSIKGDNC